MVIKNTYIFVILFLLIGCATTPPPVALELPYTPTSIEKGKGEIKIGEFTYLPAQSEKIAENQIKTPSGIFTGFWDNPNTRIFLSTSIAKHFRRAFSDELSNIGYTVGEGDIELNGEIEKLYVSRGLNPGIPSINLTIKISLVDISSQEIRMAKTFSFKERTYPGGFHRFEAGFAGMVGSPFAFRDPNPINHLIKKSIEELVTEKEFQTIISSIGL